MEQQQSSFKEKERIELREPRRFKVTIYNDDFTTMEFVGESWNQTLTNAREAGIPVALIDPKHAPEDELLYAVILHLNTNSADSGDTADTKPMTITDAVLTITRDEPHEREIKVTVS